MVDLPMMAKLAEAVRHDARLILLGDRYQLASVESGAVLAELCGAAGVNRFTAAQHAAAPGLLTERSASPTHPLADHVITLQTSRRFNADSTIGQLAAAVNAGDLETTDALLNAGHADLVYHEHVDEHGLAPLMDAVADDYARFQTITDPALAVAELERQIILTAVHEGPAGSRVLNAGITERLARHFDFAPSQTWYHGRPVMIRRNDYRTGLYNGDIGIALADGNGMIRVWFAGNDGLRALLPSALPAHDTVYAMTIHKSQGSEFETVTMVLPAPDVPVLSRELVYTGLTRARAHLSIHANRQSIRQAVAHGVTRTSHLAALIATDPSGPS